MDNGDQAETVCRICGGALRKWCDFGRQPISQSFREPGATGEEFFFHLAVGACRSCGMVQLLDEIPRELMFHAEYPYRSSGSAFMREHFERAADELLTTELDGPDPFFVEIGCNDGILLRTIREAGVRHLGIDPSQRAAEVAEESGIRVRKHFFEESVAREVRESDGPAEVIYAANTISHISYVGSILRGVAELLSPTGVFVFEERYLGDIVRRTYFDQIYDEHFYLFSVRSVRNMVARFGLELVGIEPLSVHGGSIRYAVARHGARKPAPAVADIIAEEEEHGIDQPAQLERFNLRIEQTRSELMSLLRGLRAAGNRIVGYGATAKSATVVNHCEISTDIVDFVCDSTPGKQGLLTPGMHLPVRPPEDFGNPYPDYALLFAWNHAEEIMGKEQSFRDQGGKWILYVPKVHIV